MRALILGASAFLSILTAQSLIVQSANFKLETQNLDSYKIQGSVSGLAVGGDAQAIRFSVGHLGASIPISQFTRQPDSNLLLYKDASGLAPYWVSSLSLDLDNNVFTAQATGIILTGLANPFTITLAVDRATAACVIVRYEDDNNGGYQLSGDGGMPCLMPNMPVVDKVMAGTQANSKVTVRVPADSPLDPNSLALYRAQTNGQPAGDPLCQLAGPDGDGLYSCSVAVGEISAGAYPLVLQALTADGQTVQAPGSYLYVCRPGGDSDMQQINAFQDVLSADQSFAQYGDTPQWRVALLSKLRPVFDPEPRLESRKLGLSADGLSIWFLTESIAEVGLLLNRIPAPSLDASGARTAPVANRRPVTVRPKALASDGLGTKPSPMCGEYQRDVIKNNKVLIWSPITVFMNETQPQRYTYYINGSKCPPFQVDVIPGSNADANSINSFGDYGTVLLDSHGGESLIGRGKLVTADKNLLPALTDPLNYEVSCVGITTSPFNGTVVGFGCFLSITANNPRLQPLDKALMFAGICHGDLFANVFAGPGSTGAYYAYSGTTTSSAMISDIPPILQVLINEYGSVQDAASSAFSSNGRMYGNGNLAYVGNPKISGAGQGKSQNYTTTLGGTLVLRAELEGAEQCDGTMGFHWKNTAVGGHIKPTLRGSGTDDYMGYDAQATYTANSTASGIGDQIKVDFFPDVENPIAAQACAVVTPSAKGVEVQLTGVFNYSDEGPHNTTSYNPPTKVTTDKPFTISDSGLGGSSKLTVEQISADTWKVTQEIASPTRTDIFTNTWNRVDLLIANPENSRRIKVHVEAKITGTCQGFEARLNGATGSDYQIDEGPNGCSDAWDLTQQAPTGINGRAGLFLNAATLGAKGAGRGPAQGSIVTTIQLAGN